MQTMLKIVNLTPHPVTIIRSRPGASNEGAVEHRETFPACALADLPRATEGQTFGTMHLMSDGDDTQGSYANGCALEGTGLVDRVGYSGVEGLPDAERSGIAFGHRTFYIVSIVTVIGALAAGRGICDLLVPMGQVRDSDGRIVGASGLAAAADLLAPMAERLHARWVR